MCALNQSKTDVEGIFRKTSQQEVYRIQATLGSKSSVGLIGIKYIPVDFKDIYHSQENGHSELVSKLAVRVSFFREFALYFETYFLVQMDGSIIISVYEKPNLS